MRLLRKIYLRFIWLNKCSMLIVVCFCCNFLVLRLSMRIFDYISLVRVTEDDIRFMRFLTSNGLIKRRPRCPKRNCRRNMRLAKDAGRRAKYRFKCACGTKRSIRKGSFFEKSKLSIQTILLLTFCWAAKVTVSSAVLMSYVCRTSVSQ